jgi:TnpA family transposase
VRTTVRDATYVLDGILDNQTELPIKKHTTDTAGYGDIVFALFDLLGLQFAPRLAGLPDRRLYRLGEAARTPARQLPRAQSGRLAIAQHVEQNTRSSCIGAYA